MERAFPLGAWGGGGLVSSRLFPYMHHLLIYIYDARRPRRVFGWGRNSAAAAGVK